METDTTKFFRYLVVSFLDDLNHVVGTIQGQKRPLNFLIEPVDLKNKIIIILIIIIIIIIIITLVIFMEILHCTKTAFLLQITLVTWLIQVIQVVNSTLRTAAIFIIII